MVDLQVVLQELNVGSRVAEDEADTLSSYFVETDQFRRILSGDVDVVFGTKGSGKSAIYSSILDRLDDLFDKGVYLLAGELPRGAPAFADLVGDPPTSERQFVGLWKLYITSLISDVLEEYGFAPKTTKVIRDQLVEAGLAKGPGGLKGLVRRTREYAARVGNAESLEGGLKLDPTTGMPTGITGKIVLGEPSAELREAGVVSVDDLLLAADAALGEAGFDIWVMFDRLDVAFADTPELEANALRSLFRVYLDTLSLSRIRLKIFLRTDIWRAITEGGFREASHVTRTVTISWSALSMLNLVVRRLLNNPALVEFSGAVAAEIVPDADRQRVWFDSLVPDQVDTGRNPKTFEWILNRVTDGLQVLAPREVIHMLDQAREKQLARLERGEPEPESRAVFSRAAFRDALPEVSKVRLEQTIYAEYPELKPYLERLRGEKTNQTIPSLCALWKSDSDQTASIAARAAEIGFFEVRGSKDNPDFWVPMLYRSALEMVQGSADT